MTRYTSADLGLHSTGTRTIPVFVDNERWQLTGSIVRGVNVREMEVLIPALIRPGGAYSTSKSDEYGYSMSITLNVPVE